MKIEDLVKKLKEKDQNKEVEFVVVGIAGELVCMDVKSTAMDMSKMLKLFSA